MRTRQDQATEHARLRAQRDEIEAEMRRVASPAWLHEERPVDTPAPKRPDRMICFDPCDIGMDIFSGIAGWDLANTGRIDASLGVRCNPNVRMYISKAGAYPVGVETNGTFELLRPNGGIIFQSHFTLDVPAKFDADPMTIGDRTREIVIPCGEHILWRTSCPVRAYVEFHPGRRT